jgi:L-alanine-DL-glutamate epimerase-like enolase superfamily enzyme
LAIGLCKRPWKLAKALEPYQPLFIEEPLLCEHPEAIKQLSEQTTIPKVQTGIKTQSLHLLQSLYAGL